MADGGDWESDRLEVTHAEARSVLEAQNDTMGDIDSKAMQTVRFNAVLIGLLLTAGRVAGAGVFHGGWLHVALAVLICSTAAGIATYNESNLYVGPGGTYFELAASERFAEQRRWDRNLVEGYAGMIHENEVSIEWNAWLLTVAQGTLALGIGCAVLATAI